jgi:hypothetical protein
MQAAMPAGIGGLLPAPDGTIAAADRQHLAFLYSGFTYSAPAVNDLSFMQKHGLRLVGAGG